MTVAVAAPAGTAYRVPYPRQTFWQDKAACLYTDPELFFPHPTDTINTEKARNVCRGCPVRDACLEDVMQVPASQDKDGIRGGLTPEERATLRRVRARARRRQERAGGT